MKHLSRLSDSSLAFHVQDAAAALSAMPLGHKAEQYLAEGRACQDELRRRAIIREDRSTVRTLARDPLASPLQTVHKLARQEVGCAGHPRTCRPDRQQTRATVRFFLARIHLYQTSRP